MPDPLTCFQIDECLANLASECKSGFINFEVFKYILKDDGHALNDMNCFNRGSLFSQDQAERLANYMNNKCPNCCVSERVINAFGDEDKESINTWENHKNAERLLWRAQVKIALSDHIHESDRMQEGLCGRAYWQVGMELFNQKRRNERAALVLFINPDSGGYGLQLELGPPGTTKRATVIPTTYEL